MFHYCVTHPSSKRNNHKTYRSLTAMYRSLFAFFPWPLLYPYGTWQLSRVNFLTKVVNLRWEAVLNFIYLLLNSSFQFFFFSINAFYYIFHCNLKYWGHISHISTQPYWTLFFLIFSYLWGRSFWSFIHYGANVALYQLF